MLTTQVQEIIYYSNVRKSRITLYVIHTVVRENLVYCRIHILQSKPGLHPGKW